MFREKSVPSIVKKEDASSAEQYPDYETVTDKILIGRALTIEKFGSVNVYQAAEYLYAMLYKTEEVKGFIQENDKYPDRLDIAKRGLSNKKDFIPDKESFIALIKRAMIRDVDFRECISVEAKFQLRKILELCDFTIVWTDGDVAGVPEEGIPGSYEQLIKVATSGFLNQLRRDVADQKNMNYNDVMSIYAGEKKERFIVDIVQDFKRRGIEKVVLVEDRLKNIDQVLEIFKDSGIEVLPILVLKKKESSENERIDIFTISGIEELSTLLENEGFFENKKTGAIFDFDGVLSDDSIRRKLQTDSVVKALLKKDWI